MKTLELKIPPLIWTAALALCIWACSIWLPEFQFSLPAARFWGVLCACLGLATASSGIWSFRKAQTTANPMSPGDASALVKSGPYQFTRNPMYVGMLLVLFGWFLFLHNLCGFVFVVLYLVILTELQIKPEERLLEQLFGQQYQDYKKSVPRWIC